MSTLGVDEWWEQKVGADDGAAGDVFGFSAAIDGDVALIGAAQGTAAPTGTSNGGPGAAYVYTRAARLWSFAQKLVPSDGTDDDQFGYAVALDGDTALVAAAFGDVGKNVNQGAVYVFTRGPGGWTQAQKLVADDGAAGDQFGWSIAVDGDLVIVGSRGSDIGANGSQGAAYVFARAGGTWTQAAKLVDSVGAANDQFGYSVAIHGTTALVTIPNGDATQGAAVFFDGAGGTWTQGQRIAADDGVAGENYGYSVAFDGTTALVSSPFATVGNPFQGAVYAYEKTGGTWTQTQKLVADDGQFFDVFGIALAVDGDDAIVTAPFFDASNGTAYRFVRSGGTWTQADKIVPADAVSGQGSAFGYAVALSGGSFVVGQALANNGNAYQGAAYFYEPAPTDAIFANGFEAAQ